MKTKMNRITAYLLATLMLLAAVAVPATAAEELRMFYLVQDVSASEYGLQRAHYEDAAGNTVVLNSAPASTVAKAGAYPAKFSSVDSGIVTSIKDQGDASCCWAFSTAAVLETYAVKNGYANVTNTDYSEAHLVWFSANSKSVNTADPMYGDGRTVSSPYENGNFWRYAAFSLAKGSGINNESDYPFNGSNLSAMGNYPESARYSHTAGYMTGCQLLSTDSERKAAIQKYGAITVSYGYYEQYENNVGEWVKVNGNYQWNGTTCAYNYDGSEGTKAANHMVTIVGWDDNYAVNNFASGHRPKKAGAWLCKNSWGANAGWGENGYFWISYEDKSICDTVTWQMAPAGTYDGIYQYDGFGWNALISYADSVEQANVYTASGEHILKAVGFYTAQNNVNAVVRVYTNPTDAANPSSGTLAVEQTYAAANEGYHTVSLKKDIVLTANEKFAVVVETKATNEDLLVPIEGEGVGNITCKSVSGTSYIRFANNGNRWFNCTDVGYNNNAIKAYYEDLSNGITITAKATATITKGSTLQLTAKRSGDAAGQNVVWSASPATVVSVNQNGLVTGLAAGKATVTATCGEYVDRFEITVVPNSYTLTWKVDGETVRQETVAEGAAITPYNPTKTGYVFSGWDKEVPAVMPSHSLAFSGTFTAQTYKAKFVLDGNTYEVDVKCGDTIRVPSIPKKAGYVFGGWSPALPDKMPAYDITFTGSYKIPTVSITGFAVTRNVDYQSTVSFTSDGAKLPSGAEIHWYINGTDQGTSYKAEGVTASFTVQAKLVTTDSGAVVAQSDVENVKVKDDFFSKLIAFFRSLFGALPKVEQKVEVTY